MQVGGAALDGIHHDFVDVFDDGGVIISGVDAFIQSTALIGYFQVGDFRFIDILHSESIVLTLQQFSYCRCELVLLDQQRLGMQAEAEAEVFQCRHIGRVRHGDIEGMPLSVDRQHMVFFNQLLIEVLLRDLGQIEGCKIQQRYPILQLAKIGESLALKDLVFDQEGYKWFTLGLGLAQIALGVLFTDQRRGGQA